jgi:hypothetical protein
MRQQSATQPKGHDSHASDADAYAAAAILYFELSHFQDPLRYGILSKHVSYKSSDLDNLLTCIGGAES